jgi:hypothetical protein
MDIKYSSVKIFSLIGYLHVFLHRRTMFSLSTNVHFASTEVNIYCCESVGISQP